MTSYVTLQLRNLLARKIDTVQKEGVSLSLEVAPKWAAIFYEGGTHVKKIKHLLPLLLIAVLLMGLLPLGAFAQEGAARTRLRQRPPRQRRETSFLRAVARKKHRLRQKPPRLRPRLPLHLHPRQSLRLRPHPHPRKLQKSIPLVKTSRILRNLGARAFLKAPTIPRKAAPS